METLTIALSSEVATRLHEIAEGECRTVDQQIAFWTLKCRRGYPTRFDRSAKQQPFKQSEAI